ncbi:MAG: DUF2141 domain-containing protein [Novosphingobium sp.]
MKRLALLLPLLPILNANAPMPTTVTVDVSGLRNAKGTVYICMSANPRLFPEGCDKDPAHRTASFRADQPGPLVIRDVMPGRYAIVLLHDENGNKNMDKALFLPKEGFGFSNDAPVKMSAPKFDAAAFTVTGGAPVRMKMKVRYL